MMRVLDGFYAAFNRGDIDEAVRYVDPELDFDQGVQPLDQPRHFAGVEGMREWFRLATEPWERMTVEPIERRETDDGRVLSIDSWIMHGRQQIEVERELPTLYTFRDGLIVRIEGFLDKAEALEAAGLAE